MRKLTLIGKITVIKHLILPKLLFSCQFFETPSGFVKKSENLVYRFIWNCNDRIKRKTLIADIHYGGLDMVDFECKLKSLKATWLPKLINENSDWSFFGNRYLNLLGGNHLVLLYNFILF